MSTISVLLQHSSVWGFKIRYDSYKVDGIVIHEKLSYRDLMAAIYFQLNIDESLKNIDAKYIIQVNSTTVEIHNDMSMKHF